MEVIQDGVNGLLADFFSPQEICDRIEEALNHPDKMAEIRAKARETVEKYYNLSVLLPKHLQWIQQQEDNTKLVFPSSEINNDSKVSLITEKRASTKYKESEKLTPAPLEVLQINNRKVTAQEIVPLLTQYQLLPKLKQELVIDEAIAPFSCTVEEEGKCHEEFCQQHQLTSEFERQNWLQQQGITEAQFLELATRKLRIEKFQQATWGSHLESYFRQRKQQLDQVIYSLIRTKDADLARELYFRLLEDEQPFAELARQYSEGTETSTGGLIGPVPLSSPHPKLAQILTINQPGQLSPPTRVGEWWIIVRLEKLLPAKLDEPMKQKLLNELFNTWLQEQLQSPIAKQPVEIKQSA
jgi:parvulin-like peptidyl-prolyl isomerase